MQSAAAHATSVISRYSMETLCSDSIERIARMLDVQVDLDEPEPAFVAAVERAVASLVERAKLGQDEWIPR